MMQKKYEKLPGLSNVSGKYTKRCSTDSFPHFSSAQRSGTLSPSSSTYYASALPVPDKVVSSPTKYTESDRRTVTTHCVPSSGSVAHANNTSNRFSSRHASQNPTPFCQNYAAVSSPSWPSSLSVATSDSRIPSVNTSSLTTGTMRRLRKSEIVKSSSSGSVVNLSQKPTGIILATPSTPQIKTKPFSRFKYANKSAVTAGATESSEHQAPSTPYPIRQSYLSSDDRSLMQKDDQLLNEHSTLEHSSGFAFPSQSARPSVLVRPMNQLFSCKSGLSSDALTDAINIASSTSPKRYSGFCAGNFQKPFPPWHMTSRKSNATFCPQMDQQYVDSDSATNSNELLALKSNHSCVPCFKFNSDIHSEACAAGTVYSCTELDSTRMQRQQTPFHSPHTHISNYRLCGTQPHHTLWGSVRQPRPPLSSPAIALPGPQYTQYALEQYLSDLLVEEQATVTDLTGDLASRRSDTTISQFSNLKDQLESLQFLQYRIESALQVVREEGSASAIFHPNGGECTSPLSKENATPISHHSTVPGPKSILEQFSMNELQYLLKAVQDLIVLRSQTTMHSLPSTSLSNSSSTNPRAPKSRSSSHVRIADSAAIAVDSLNTLDDSINGEEVEEVLPAHAVADADSSTAHLMHKRLPLGFQHFKRYLDSKFGPDYHNHPCRAVPSPMHSTESMRCCIAHSPTLSERDIREVTSSHFTNETNWVTNSTSPEVISIPEDGERHCSGGKRVSSSRSFETHGLYYSHGTGMEQRQTPTHLGTVSSPSCANSVFPTTMWESGTPVTSDVCHSSSCDSASSQPPPQPERHFDTCTQWPSHVSSSPFHQRSYCSTPEVPDIPRSAYTRWPPHTPQLCYWSHYPSIEPMTHCLPSIRHAHQRATPLTNEYCSCGLEYHPSGCLAYIHAGSPTNPGGMLLRSNDMNHLAAEALLSHPSTVSQCFIPPAHQSLMDDGTYGRNPYVDTSQVTPLWTNPCSLCGDGGGSGPVSGVLRAFPRTHLLPTSPTYDWALWGSAAWNSRFPCYHSGLVSPYPTRMPRSGSAGAGFAYALVDNTAPTATYVQNTTSREHSIGPDRSVRIQPQPIPRSMPHFQLRSPGAVAEVGYDTSTNSWLRPVSNSLSANDLLAYRTVKSSSKDLRSPKSSIYELAPELPYEPDLALTHCSHFYSKLATFIEMDNSLQLSVPMGWCEKRSSFGRSYYACEQTKQASWHHPTFGLLVPLGWERVDSCQNGVYYQHLLIPHCQRHHPNLWIPGPLKDPAVEHESFFSDLRYLQSSMRHHVTKNCTGLEKYKHTTSLSDERAFLHAFCQFDVETMVEVTRALDQLFYRELHTLVVFYERERLKIVSDMFAFDRSETIFSTSEEV